MGTRLAGRTAIITGAAKGMGAAHARRFVAEGARVVLGDVLDEAGEAVAAELGDAARYVHLDVTDPAQWAAAVAVAEELGTLNVLINNAGIHWIRPIEHETVEGIERILRVNLVGTMLGIQAVIPAMRAAGGGSIVNLSSTAGLTGLPYHGAYGASKWAVRGLTKTAAVELGGDGIRVNSVHPGPIRTDMMSFVGSAEDEKRRFAHLPARRPGEPDEVSQLMVYLASDESSFMTGAEFVIDGGSQAGPAPSFTWTPERGPKGPGA
jgi:3alpha(or 20beta)-hydroxysteroid dehydrogenase